MTQSRIELTLIDHWPDTILGLPPGRYVVRVPVARLLSDHDLALTVHIIRGQGKGPVLGLLAGIHGDETPGARCIYHVLADLDTTALRGAVVAVPVANPLAWQAQTRTTPERDVDQANLARVFKARPELTAPAGSLTRHLAAALENSFFAAITHLIDYHCFGRDTAARLMLYRTGQAEAALETSARMARVFGVGVVRGVTGGQGTTSAYAAALGIPTCVAEMGGRLSREADAAFARQGADGARRVMQTLEMIKTAPLVPEPQLVVENSLLISPRTSGYYLPRYDLEDLARPEYPNGIPVKAGELLGHVFDPYTLRLVETLTAPEDGYLIILARGGPFQIGGLNLTLAQGRLE